MKVWNFDLPHVHWFRQMRRHIRKAKDCPNVNEGYCRAAAIARMEFECAWALYKVSHAA